MKFSQITVDEVVEYCNAYESDKKILNIILVAAKSHIKGITGRTEEDLDKFEDVTIAVLILCNEMFENRLFSVENNKVNLVVDSIINKYSINLL